MQGSRFLAQIISGLKHPNYVGSSNAIDVLGFNYSSVQMEHWDRGGSASCKLVGCCPLARMLSLLPWNRR
jgi:hypothetical protein